MSRQVAGETRGPSGVRRRGFPGATLGGPQGDPVQGAWLAGHWAQPEPKVQGPTMGRLFNKYGRAAYWLRTVLVPVRQKRSLLRGLQSSQIRSYAHGMSDGGE